MRIITTDGKPLSTRGILTFDHAQLAERLLALNPARPETLTTEEVFRGSHRLVGTCKFIPSSSAQRFSLENRSSELAEIASPYIQLLKQHFPGHEAVMIQCATLPPGIELKWHVDPFMYHSLSHKIHFPVITVPEARFETYSAGKITSEHLMAGHAVEINNLMYHRAVNHGSSNRIHLIIDMMHLADIQRFIERGIDMYFTDNPIARARQSKVPHEIRPTR